MIFMEYIFFLPESWIIVVRNWTITNKASCFCTCPLDEGINYQRASESFRYKCESHCCTLYQWNYENNSSITSIRRWNNEGNSHISQFCLPIFLFSYLSWFFLVLILVYIQDIFEVLIDALALLDDISSHLYTKRVVILGTLAKVKSCIIMWDLNCDELVLQMFNNFFNAMR